MAAARTSRSSRLEGLRRSIKSVIVGVFCVVASIVVLFWNEGRAVREVRARDRRLAGVTSIGPGQVDKANDGKLVHVTGNVVGAAELTDPLLGVSAEGVKLLRKVEMYQWREVVKKETVRRLDRPTETVTRLVYEKVWSPRLINSEGFKKLGHSNPPRMRFTTHAETARGVRLGAFALSDELAAQMEVGEALAVGAEALAKVPEDHRRGLLARDGGFYLPYHPASDGTTAAVGDLRITFHVARPGVMSAIGVQVGSRLAPYVAPAGSTGGLFRRGVHSPGEMLLASGGSGGMLVWVLRAAGAVVLLAGLLLVLRAGAGRGRPVAAIAGLLRGGVVGVAATLSLSLWFITVGLAWVLDRPAIGGAALAAALAVFLGGSILSRRGSGAGRG